MFYLPFCYAHFYGVCTSLAPSYPPPLLPIPPTFLFVLRLFLFEGLDRHFGTDYKVTDGAGFLLLVKTAALV
jgi:hypothetical protein